LYSLRPAQPEACYSSRSLVDSSPSSIQNPRSIVHGGPPQGRVMYGYSDPSYPAWRCLLRGPESSCRHWGLLRFLYECLADVEYTVEDGSLGKYARLLISFETSSLWTWSCRRGSSWSCGFYPFLRCVESRWDCRGICLVMDDFFEGESITRGCGFMVEVGLMGARRLFWKVGYHLC
jgi:hypothetical protein